MRGFSAALLGIKGLRMQLSSVHRLTHTQAADLARVTDPIADIILAAIDERDREADTKLDQNNWQSEDAA